MEDGYECKFRCKCGEKTFKVRYRNQGEDLVAYVEGVIRPAMAKAHVLQSPLCPSPSADLMIPVSNAAGIGMRVLQ